MLRTFCWVKFRVDGPWQLAQVRDIESLVVFGDERVYNPSDIVVRSDPIELSEPVDENVEA